MVLLVAREVCYFAVALTGLVMLECGNVIKALRNATVSRQNLALYKILARRCPYISALESASIGSVTILFYDGRI